MSEILDRAAAVLAGRLGQDWATMPDEARLAVRGHAVAVIEAIREPSEAMCDAATRSTSAWLNSSGVALRRLKLQIRWRAMIDELLRP